MSRRERWLCLVGFSLGGLVSCGGSEPPQLAERTLHRGIGGDPSTFDPTAVTDNYSYEILRDLYEGLTAETPAGKVIPGVAASWTVDSAGTRYTFHLREDARWSNGEPVKAAAFITAWRRVVDPKTASPVADDLRLIAGANSIINGKSAPASLGAYAASDHVLVVDLERPAAYFPELLSHPAAYPIYSATAAATQDPKRWISNGAYVLAARRPGATIELARNDYYWDRRDVAIPRVEYQIADENSQFARYRAGQLDMTDTVPANALPKLRQDHASELHIAPFLGTAYYGLNLHSTVFSSNIALRHAIALAIDRKRLVDALAFGQAEAYSFVPPQTWNYAPQYWPWKDLSEADRAAEAKRLYREAGYSVAVALRLRLLYNADPVIRRTAIMVAGMLHDTLGIDVELIEEEYKVFLRSRQDVAGWDIARLGWTADFNDASNFLEMFRSHSTNNDPGYSNPVVDDWLERAANEADADRRRTDLEASERAMLADYPIVPLYFFVSKRLVKPYVLGIGANPLNKVNSSFLHFSTAP